MKAGMTQWRRTAATVVMPNGQCTTGLLMVFAVAFAVPVAVAAEPVDNAAWQSQRSESLVREARFNSESSLPPARREAPAPGGVRSGSYAAGDAPEASRPLRFSSEERRQLRRDLHDAGRDLYSPHR